MPFCSHKPFAAIISCHRLQNILLAKKENQKNPWLLYVTCWDRQGGEICLCCPFQKFPSPRPELRTNETVWEKQYIISLLCSAVFLHSGPLPQDGVTAGPDVWTRPLPAIHMSNIARWVESNSTEYKSSRTFLRDNCLLNASLPSGRFFCTVAVSVHIAVLIRRPAAAACRAVSSMFLASAAARNLRNV